MSDLSTLERIRLTVARRNPRIQDNFADFDRLRSGNVTKDQFRRCLTIANLTDGLSEDDVVQLVDKYTSPSNPILASYTRFLGDLSATEAPVTQLSPSRGTVKPLTLEEETAIERSYAFFRQRIQATSLDIRTLFKDFDKRNNGTITAAQFERCFPFKVDPAVMNAIKKKYSSGTGDISYLNWCADVLEQPLGDGTIRFRSGVSTNTRNGGNSRDVLELVEQIRVQLATNRLRCDDFLRDYDKLNTGVVSPSQFAAALGRVQFVRFQLTADDLAQLCAYYATEDKSGQAKVNYANFLAAVAPHVQPTPTGGLNQTYGTYLDNEAQKRCDVVVEKIRNAIATRRMNLRPTFHDFDQAQNGLYRTRTCTRSRFERALAINKIDVTPAEVALLARRYATTASNAGDDINYNAFCNDVDQPLEGDAASNINFRAAASGSGSGSGSFLPSISKNGSGAAAGSAASGADIGLILDKIMQVVIARRVRLSEFIRDNDPLRSGAIPKDRFLSSILTSNVVLNKNELETLAEHYAHPTIKGYVNSSRFLADIDTGAQIIHPAQDPLDREVEVKNRTLGSYAGKKDATLQTNGPQLAMILRRIAEDVRARGVLLPPFFKDYDTHKCGRITKAQFHQTLSRHKVPATEQDIDLLKQFYEDPTDKLMIKYRDFIGDVDESENVAAQLELRHSVRKLPNANGTTLSGSSSSNNNNASSGAAGSSSPTRFQGTFTANNTVADAVLQKIADFILRRNVRIEEFCKDGDPLKKGFLSNHRFRHAIDILGIALAENEMAALEQAFSSAKAPESVNYVQFLEAVKETRAQSQVHSMSGVRAEAARQRSEVEDKLLERIILKVQRAFGSRRIASRQVFQDYDKLHKGRVPEGHFFTALLSVGLSLTPTENAALKKAYTQGDGSMVYGEFSARIDENLGLDK